MHISVAGRPPGSASQSVTKVLQIATIMRRQRALRSAAADRELDLQKQLRSEVEGRRAEVEGLRLELESVAMAAEERRRKEVREVKSLAEGRERELRRAHAQRPPVNVLGAHAPREARQVRQRR